MERWLFLLRAFVPSWRFFDDVGTDLILEACVNPQDQEMEEWRACLPPIERSFKHILFNPQGNFLHACHNHLQHLVLDLDSMDLENETSYKITRNLVQFQLRKELQAPFQFQFRVRERGHEAFLISAVYEVLP